MKRWKTILLVFFLLGITTQVAKTQSEKRDSLLSIWYDLSESDTVRFIALNGILSGRLFRQQPDSSIYYAHQQYLLGLELNNRKWQHLGLAKEADWMIKVGRMEEALAISRQALELQQDRGGYKYIADSYRRIAYILRKQGRTTESLATYKQGLNHLAASGKEGSSRMAAMLNSMGSLYLNIGNNEEAKTYYERTLTLYRKLKSEEGIASVLINLSNVARNEEDYSGSLGYLNEALPMAEKLENPERLANIFQGIGNTHLSLKDYERAEAFFLKSLAYRLDLGLVGDVSATYATLGRTASLVGKPKEAIDYCQKGLELAEQASNVRQIAISCLCLYQANKQMNNNGLALGFYEDYIIYRDSLVGADASRQLALQQAEYEYEKEHITAQAKFDQEKMALAAYADRQEMLRNVFIGLVTILVLVVLLTYRTTRVIRRKTAQLAEQNKTITTQRNELSRLDEMKSRFFTNISHELRTPLTLILLPIERLLKGASDELSDTALKSLGTAKKNAGRLMTLVEDILDLASMENESRIAEPVRVNIQEELEEILHAVRPAAEEKNIDFKLNYSKLPTNTILLDAGSFQKIVGNLLFNAVKYTPNGGWIEIKGGTDGPNIGLSILDSGKGISPEDLPHVFDRFFQTKDTAKKLEGGSGIGLALAQELVHSMGGEITVKTEAEAGACFMLSLPFKEVQGEQNTAATEEANEARPQVQEEGMEEHSEAVASHWPNAKTSGAHVLIVEDNADMRDLLKELLAPTYECTCVADGQEALDIIATTSKHFDLVLSDVMMPNMDGYELLQKLKASTATALIPVVMLTARTAEKDRLQALRLGVDDYLAKPFSAEELLLRIHHLICRARIREASSGTSTIEQDSVDEHWLKELETLAQEALLKQLPLNAEYLAGSSHISKRTLQRHLKAATGLSMKQYILEIKLNRARVLLEKKQIRTVAEVTYASGFSTPAYFSRIFNERFGRRPVSYLKS